jgi:hypothetical protein
MTRTFTHPGIVGEIRTKRFRDRLTQYFSGPHYVYTLADPRTGIVRYVGMTENPIQRRRSLLATSATKPLGEWLLELAEAGVTPVFTIIETCRGNPTARLREQHWIAHYVKVSGAHMLFNRKCGRLGRFDKPTRELAEL